MGIGKNVKALAKSRRLSLVELSEKSGVPLNTIYTLTREDSRNATMRTLDKLAEALKVDVRTLQTGMEYAPERVKEKEINLTKVILEIIKTLSTPEDIDWVHVQDLVIEAEQLDSEIKEEK